MLNRTLTLINKIRFCFILSVLFYPSELSATYSPDPVRTFADVVIADAIPMVTEEVNNPKDDDLLASYQDQLLQKVIDEQLFTNKLDSSSFFSLPVGVTVNKDQPEKYMIVVDKVSVFPSYAEFSAFMILTNPFDGTKVRFKTENVRFSFKGGIQGNLKLELCDSVKMKLVNDVNLIWMPGSFVDWDCNGFRQVGICADVKLSEKRFVGVNPVTGNETGAVKSSFFSVLSDFDNFLLDVSFSPFKIRGINDLIFSFNNVVLDFSDKSNASGFKLPNGYPSGYEGEFFPLWRGLYIGSAEITLDKKFNQKDGTKTSVFAMGLIIDDYGLSGVAGARNILGLDKGQLGNWQFAIDEFSMSFLTGNLSGLTFEGRTVLPGTSNPVSYEAFMDVDGNYHFGISPGSNFNFDVFAATVDIDKSSHIDVDVIDGAFVPTAILNGNISFSCSKSLDNTDKKILKIPTIAFEGMRISAAPPVFDLEVLGIESDGEMEFGTFPISLTKAYFNKGNGHNARFDFEVKVKLSPVNEEALVGLTNISVLCDLSKEKWEYKGLKLNVLKVDAKKEGAYEIHGEIEFKEGDATYGDGFRGLVSALFVDKFKFESVAVFGRVNSFRYFMVDAFATMEPGIPAGPFIVNGFGGGLYYRMRQQTTQESTGSDFGKNLAQQIYLPDNNVSLGIKAAIGAGIVNKKIIDAKVSLEVIFNNNGGINQVGFHGEASVISPSDLLSSEQLKQMSEKMAKGEKQKVSSNEMMRATVDLLLDFERDVFHAEMELYLNVAGVLKGRGANNRAGWGVMHIDPDKWYLHLGTPTDPIGLDFIGLMQVGSYFMAGHDIPDAMMMNRRVLDILNMTNEDFNGQRKDNDLALGKGLAFGASFDLDTKDLTFLIFYARFMLGGGFDVMLLDYGPDAYCLGHSAPVGINGWFAKGQAYAYFGGEIGIKVRIFRRKRKFEIINLQTAAALRIEGPNPTWMKGVVGGKYKILGGLVKGRCKFQASIGEKCDLQYSRDLSDLEIIGGLSPATNSYDVDIFTLPQGVFNMPIGKTLKFSENENSTKEFRINLVEFALYRDGQIIPGLFEWDEDQTTLAYTPYEIFDPNTSYKIVAKVSFEEKINGKWETYKDESGNLYVETKEASFTIGDKPDKIPSEYVTYTYPVDRMMNFYKNESNTAYVTFKANIATFFRPEDGWGQRCKWTPVLGGQPLYSTLTYKPDQKCVETPVPAGLSAKTMYHFDIEEYPLSAINAIDRNVVTQSNIDVSEGADTTAMITTRQAEGVIEDTEVRSIYSLDFRTSKYNTFSDKLSVNEMTIKWLDRVSPAVDNLIATKYDDEMFDSYEIRGNSLFGPIVAIEASLDGADWYQNNIYSLMYQDYPLHPEALVSRNTSLGGIPPVKPVELWQIDYDYTLTDLDVQTGRMSSRADMTHFVYGLARTWAADYYDIRNNIANLIYKNAITITPRVEQIMGTYPWPQASLGNYPFLVQYKLPGRQVSSSRIINMKNPFSIKQVNLKANE